MSLFYEFSDYLTIIISILYKHRVHLSLPCGLIESIVYFISLYSCQLNYISYYICLLCFIMYHLFLH